MTWLGSIVARVCVHDPDRILATRRHFLLGLRHSPPHGSVSVMFVRAHCFFFLPTMGRNYRVRSGQKGMIQAGPCVHDQGPWSSGMQHLFRMFLRKWLLADAAQVAQDVHSKGSGAGGRFRFLGRLSHKFAANRYSRRRLARFACFRRALPNDRSPRNQKKKGPFSAAELKEKGLVKV
jgi:hypothetical protein